MIGPCNYAFFGFSPFKFFCFIFVLPNMFLFVLGPCSFVLVPVKLVLIGISPCDIYNI